MLQRFQSVVDSLPDAQASSLVDSGIIGTPLHYAFSFEVADWLARRDPDAVTIDWAELDDTGRLDELLEQLTHPAETDYFESGQVTSGNGSRWSWERAHPTDFAWLFSELRQRRSDSRFWAPMYNAAEIPLAWDLRDSNLSKSRTTFRSGFIAARSGGLRTRVPYPKRAVRQPLESIIHLSPRRGQRMIDTGMAAMAVRHRETYHFNFANPGEVYLADVGEGVTIAIIGLQSDHRLLLECNMGHLVLANGVPVGYGGGAVLFRQVNTGINIFDEYRGSEAAFLWIQVMRVYHYLFGCNRYVANPYQFGAENTEALKTGAFWFYYRLGYRPVEKQIRTLAQREWKRIRSNPRYRSR